MNMNAHQNNESPKSYELELLSKWIETFLDCELDPDLSGTKKRLELLFEGFIGSELCTQMDPIDKQNLFGTWCKFNQLLDILNKYPRTTRIVSQIAFK